MEIEILNVQSQNIKKLEFTVDQVLYLNTQLPKGYSFLTLTKSIKQIKEPLVKPKKNKFKTDNDEHSQTIRSVKQFDRSTSFIKKERSKPLASITHSAPIIKQHKIIQKKIKITADMIAPELMSCWNLLQILKKHPSSWPFLAPVDHVALQIPTYLEIIKEPMDFGTIQINLGSGTYETQTQFHADIGKVFMNSYRFNPAGSEYHLITKQLEQFYDLAVDNPQISIPQKSKIIAPQPVVNYSIPKKISTNKRTAEVDPSVKSAPKKKKPLYQPQLISMTATQKKTLGQNIRRLPRDSLRGVWQIVNDNNMSPEQLKFDLDKLPLGKARQLQRYVNSQLQINFKTELIPKDTMQTNASFRQKSQVSEDASSFMSDESN